jgi:hypothetical protein
MLNIYIKVYFNVFSEIKEIPVFHENEQEIILKKLGLWEKIINGELTCFFCGDKITKENLGCIFIDKNKRFQICCSKPTCFEKISTEINNNE